MSTNKQRHLLSLGTRFMLARYRAFFFACWLLRKCLGIGTAIAWHNVYQRGDIPTSRALPFDVIGMALSSRRDYYKIGLEAWVDEVDPYSKWHCTAQGKIQGDVFMDRWGVLRVPVLVLGGVVEFPIEDVSIRQKYADGNESLHTYDEWCGHVRKMNNTTAAGKAVSGLNMEEFIVPRTLMEPLDFGDDDTDTPTPLTMKLSMKMAENPDFGPNGDDSPELSWYEDPATPQAVKDIRAKYMAIAGESAMCFGPAHIIWSDGNYESRHARWCLDNFDESLKHCSQLDTWTAEQIEAVRQSLRELLALDIKDWIDVEAPPEGKIGEVRISESGEVAPKPCPNAIAWDGKLDTLGMEYIGFYSGQWKCLKTCPCNPLKKII